MGLTDIELRGFPPSIKEVAKDGEKKQIKVKYKGISEQLSQPQSPTLEKLKEYEKQLQNLKPQLIALEQQSKAKKGVLGRIWKGAKRVFGPGKTARNIDSLLRTIRKKQFVSAITEGNIQEVNERIKKDKTLLTKAVDRKHTPIFVAAMKNQSEMLKNLIAQGASLKSKKIYGKHQEEDLLVVAAEHGAVDCVKELLNGEKDWRYWVDKAWIAAVKKNQKETVQAILIWAKENNFPLNIDVYLCLDPKKNEQYEITKLLINSGAYEKSSASYLLDRAINESNFEIFKLLLNNIEKNNLISTGNAGYYEPYYLLRGAIEQAAKKNAPQAAKRILEEFINQSAQAKTKASQEALSIGLDQAIESEDIGIANCLLEAGANPNKEHALHKAVRKRNIELVKLLLKYKATQSKDDYNKTPLTIAIQNCDENIVEKLLSDEQKPNLSETVYSMRSTKRDESLANVIQKNKSIAKLLLQSAIKEDNKALKNQILAQWTKFCSNYEVFAKKGEWESDIDEILTLLFNNIDPNAKLVAGDEPILIWAIRSRNPAYVEILLKRGAKTDCKNRYGTFPLLAAVSWGEQEIVQLLLENKADRQQLSDRNKTLVEAAFLGNNTTMAQFLLENNVRVPPDDGRRILLETLDARFPDYNKLHVLVSHGISLDKQDVKKYLRLMRNIDHEKVIKLLLDEGKKLNISFFSMAIENGETDLVKKFLKFRADPNEKDSKEDTLLHKAVRAGNFAMVQKLLKYEANKHTYNTEGKTPLDLCSGILGYRIRKLLQ